jgi:uncharacterized protein YbcV (DUF1398 family)
MNFNETFMKLQNKTNSSYHFNQHVHEQIQYDIYYVTQGNVTQVCNTYVIEITKSFKKMEKKKSKMSKLMT